MPVLDSLVFAVCVSTVLGFLAGIGIGGGSLLVLWLTFVLRLEPGDVRSINLLFFLPCAIISSIFRGNQGDIPFKKLLPGMIAGCAASGVFSLITSGIRMDWLKKGFGVLLIAAGLRELFYRKTKK